MRTLATLTDRQIEDRVGSASFQRGVQYFRRGAIFDARRQGATLKARSEGSGPEAYHLWATLGDSSVVAASCSCPVGAGGHCKHTAALLLTWRERPEEFVEIEDLDVALERRSKAELIALVKQMLLLQPNFERLIEAPPPGQGTSVSADPKVYRRQAVAVFRRAGSQWGAEGDIANELLALKIKGDDYAAQGEVEAAVATYDAISEVVVENLEMYDDEGGALREVIAECAEALGGCLADSRTPPAAREVILEALFSAYHSDTDAGGLGSDGNASELILQHATPDERRLVAGWVREAVAELPESMDAFSRRWRSEAYGGFLLQLESDEPDDDAFLALCRETGRTADLVERLLQRDRHAEALAEAEQADDHLLPVLADFFVEHGREDLGEQLVSSHLASGHIRVHEWLKQRYLTRGDLAAALNLVQQWFKQHPSLGTYQQARDLASQLGTWDHLRPELRRAASQGSWADALLIQIYLDDGEVATAIEAMRTLRSAPAYSDIYGESLRLKVARAAEAIDPQAAIELYQQEVERLITMQGRERYREAAQHLTRVRSIYDRLGAQAEWAAAVADLRERWRRLSALKQELTAAGL